MANKKGLYTAFNILLYAAGFPVLFIISLVKSIEWNSYGMYGAASFTPLIAVIILWVLVGGIQALVYNLLRKKGKTGKSLKIKVMVIPLAVIIGLLGILDIAMPPLLKDGTSNTILYEDVVNDWQGTHDKLVDRVEAFKKKNGMADSVKYQDKEFQDKFHMFFDSMDQAYKAFDPLALEMALDSPDMLEAIKNGNFPIMVAVTLLLPTATGNDNNHNLEGLEDLLTQNIGTIGKLVAEINANGLQTDPASINKYLNMVLVTKNFNGFRWNIFNILGNNMLFPEIDPNAEIHRYSESGLTDYGSQGGCLGYLDMSWLNGIPSMFFIPLMSIRDLLYLFAALIAVFAMIQFYVAECYAKKNGTEFSLYMLGRKK